MEVKMTESAAITLLRAISLLSAIILATMATSPPRVFVSAPFPGGSGFSGSSRLESPKSSDSSSSSYQQTDSFDEFRKEFQPLK